MIGVAFVGVAVLFALFLTLNAAFSFQMGARRELSVIRAQVAILGWVVVAVVIQVALLMSLFG